MNKRNEFLSDCEINYCRLFRTTYDPVFSPSKDVYEIKCIDPYTCSWINIHRALQSYKDVKVFASIWSPPHYMKNNLSQLIPTHETAFLHFIRNITAIIKRDFEIDIEKVSPVNEPENAFAQWDHTNMDPIQLCRIISNYNDPLISVCPENAWFSLTTTYFNPLLPPCDIMATHAYALNSDVTSPNFMLGYYDPVSYSYRGTNGPLWMTEVSSTYVEANVTQMEEALDLANNIVNFVGVTCVQRYYFWYAYTKDYSGESLIWGYENGELYLPKKFFVFKLFVTASNTTYTSTEVNDCDVITSLKFPCIQFGDVDRVLINADANAKQTKANECSSLCCVTETEDFVCFDDTERVPSKSVCHCILN